VILRPIKWFCWEQVKRFVSRNVILGLYERDFGFVPTRFWWNAILSGNAIFHCAVILRFYNILAFWYKYNIPF
jgi:hypothetical protein